METRRDGSELKKTVSDRKYDMARVREEVGQIGWYLRQKIQKGEKKLRETQRKN